MTVVDARPPASPPTPEECEHPAPVRGVMAHEFATYQGAMGPEGKRRTVTHYGPVLGGLPIEAWHCEVCGLLRLTFPDGRVEVMASGIISVNPAIPEVINGLLTMSFAISPHMKN